jgi:hypothetical protein
MSALVRRSYFFARRDLVPGPPSAAPMTLPPQTLLTPEEQELDRKRAALAALEAQLADRELELAGLRADLIQFEKRYLHVVGRRYALLDDLKAKIAEARSRRNPDSREARERADQARSKAQESARAAGQEDTNGTPMADAALPSARARSPSLDKLYRQAAKLLHPDLTLDGDEKVTRHRLMAELNAAHASGDEERIRAILRDWHASPDNVTGDGAGAELVRVIRKIAQVEKRLSKIATELDHVRQGELFKLNQQFEEAQARGCDLLNDLCQQLDGEIAQAREKLKLASKGTP